jgi:hypothetical protein
VPDLPYDDLTDPLRLADWLELYAMASPDSNSSRGDLDSALHTASHSELGSDAEIEQKILEVFGEFEQRAKAAREAYPFDIDFRGILRLKAGGWEAFPVYTFCLCLSYYPLRETQIGPRIFEQVSCLAARGYLRGRAVGFGSPRVALPSSFADAVTELCKLIGEGGGYLEQPSLGRQDDTLDLVAWKDFEDKRPSKVLMFGQCGAGRNWSEKLGELQPNPFWKQWMRVGSVSPTPIKSFFTPYRVGQRLWELHARKAGILFDRCRIAYWAHHEETDHSSLVEWTADFLRSEAI